MCIRPRRPRARRGIGRRFHRRARRRRRGAGNRFHARAVLGHRVRALPALPCLRIRTAGRTSTGCTSDPDAAADASRPRLGHVHGRLRPRARGGRGRPATSRVGQRAAGDRRRRDGSERHRPPRRRRQAHSPDRRSTARTPRATGRGGPRGPGKARQGQDRHVDGRWRRGAGARTEPGCDAAGRVAPPLRRRRHRPIARRPRERRQPAPHRVAAPCHRVRRGRPERHGRRLSCGAARATEDPGAWPGMARGPARSRERRADVAAARVVVAGSGGVRDRLRPGALGGPQQDVEFPAVRRGRRHSARAGAGARRGLRQQQDPPRATPRRRGRTRSTERHDQARLPDAEEPPRPGRLPAPGHGDRRRMARGVRRGHTGASQSA